MTTHAMIDLETLGTAPDCAVLTIGAIKFDPNIAKPAWDEFYYRFGNEISPDFFLEAFCMNTF